MALPEAGQPDRGARLLRPHQVSDGLENDGGSTQEQVSVATVLEFTCLTQARFTISRYYVARRLFMADMARIFTNCRLYNSPETEYYR